LLSFDLLQQTRSKINGISYLLPSVIPALRRDPLVRRTGGAAQRTVHAAAPWIPALASLGRDDDQEAG
jgi:hypothetical protein